MDAPSPRIKHRIPDTHLSRQYLYDPEGATRIERANHRGHPHRDHHPPRNFSMFQTKISVALAAFLSVSLLGQARADFTLTQAALDQGLRLSTFATGFPSSSRVGPLGMAFLSSGGVLVTDYPGNIRLFPTDTDGQVAPAPLKNYGFGNAHGLTMVGASIYMTQKFAGNLVQINPDGTIAQTIKSGLNTPLDVVANPANGHLFVSTAAGIIDIDPIARTSTTLVNRSADGLTVSRDGRTVYGEISSHILGFSTTTGGQVFDSGFIGNGPDGTAIGFGPLAGTILANTNGGTLVEINLTTSVQTLLGSGGSRGDFVVVDPNDGSLLLTQTDRILRLSGVSFVPEPSSVVLLGLGAVGLVATGWRRARRARA
jgi:hypothetical protein